jgi:hypothetical protein
MTDAASSTGSATGAGLAPSGAVPSSGTGAATPKPFGHGSKESAVASVIGAHAGEDKARAERDRRQVRVVKSRNPNEPPTIHGESIAEMRARVKREREAAPPTEFQRSLIGTRPGDVSDDASLASLGAPSGVTTSGATPSSATPA